MDVDELFDITAGPGGGVPDAVAVFAIAPEFTSACVIVRVAVQVVDAAGVSVVEGHEMLDKPVSGSVMLTVVKVTLPVLVTRNENVCTSPNDAPVGAVSAVKATDFAKDNAFTWVIGVVVDDPGDVTAGPVGGVPDAVAVFVTDPIFTSDCVMVRVAVHVVDAPGASVVDGQLIADKPASGSDTDTDVRVTLPEFVTAKENVWVSPSDAPVGAVSVVRVTVLVRLIVFV